MRIYQAIAIFVFLASFIASAAESNLYRVNSDEWLRHKRASGEVFTCKPCTDQVQIEVSIGPELPPDALFKNNEEFIQSLSKPEDQRAFARSLIEASVPGKFRIKIPRAGLSSLGGLKVFQFHATVEFGPNLSRDTTMVAVHRNHIVKISLNYFDGGMNKETSQIISNFFSSFKFVGAGKD